MAHGLSMVEGAQNNNNWPTLIKRQLAAKPHFGQGLQGPWSKSMFLHVKSSLDLQHQCHVCLGKGLVELLVQAARVQRAFRQSFSTQAACSAQLSMSALLALRRIISGVAKNLLMA